MLSKTIFSENIMQEKMLGVIQIPSVSYSVYFKMSCLCWTFCYKCLITTFEESMQNYTEYRGRFIDIRIFTTQYQSWHRPPKSSISQALVICMVVWGRLRLLWFALGLLLFYCIWISTINITRSCRIRTVEAHKAPALLCCF